MDKKDAIQYLKSVGITQKKIVNRRPLGLTAAQVNEAFNYIYRTTEYDENTNEFICDGVELRPRMLARFVWQKAQDY